MMLYLCSHNNVNLFDWLNESSLVAQPFMLKKISSTQLDLSAFAKKEAIGINYYKYLAIDLSAVVNDTETFKLAIQSIHIMNPKIKFLYIDIGNKTNVLQEVLKTFGDIPVITENPEEDMSRFKTQVTAGLQYTQQILDTEKESRGNTVIASNTTTGKNEASKKCEAKKEYIFKNQKVMVAVINAYPRAGSTTLSINMAAYLNSIGATVSCVELNGELGHLDKIINSTPGFTAVTENRFEREGVVYLKGEIPEEVNFVINDMSRVIQDESSEGALEFAKNCNVAILCGTSKPYELQEIKKKIELLQKYGCYKINLCLAFTPEHEKAHLADLFGDKHISVYFTEYTPDMFAEDVNSDVFQRIFQEYIKEKTNDNMVKLF
ncbi:hypothetical protein [Ruminiclostridium cellulolyticum]|uniref:Uncharacterized protein n=1 Tax=Ruminiclostridium cellulolyticum (strain ATCC 35319 / DSM 5812 / JCM 6584 / H10) TaxID=394503 RepID=B8I089_RUMCH|nr:hypothetical protein [Ruminiclostridium cellulolyticum]ACL77415.1 hypothetical protein Ccel_3124 [Ruminiclostridium cellulolyticum H10]